MEDIVCRMVLETDYFFVSVQIWTDSERLARFLLESIEHWLIVRPEIDVLDSSIHCTPIFLA